MNQLSIGNDNGANGGQLAVMEESRQELVRFYDSLDVETREFIQAEEQDIVMIRAHADILTGQKLARIKARLPHGQWENYLRIRWKASIRQAQNLIKKAEIYKNADSAFLESCGDYALTLLAYAPESARIEAQDRSDSGEHISAKLAKEIADRHKAEVEAAKAEADQLRRETKVSQQTITSQQEQIAQMEAERTELRSKINASLLTKQADDEAIIRQQNKFEKLNKQINELKAQIAEPQVIEKVIEKEVEKIIEKVPDDYGKVKADLLVEQEKSEKIRREIEEANKKLEATKQKLEKAKKDAEFYEKHRNLAEERLQQTIKELTGLTDEGKILRKSRDLFMNAYKAVDNAITSLKIRGQVHATEQITKYASLIKEDIEKFLSVDKVIDLEALDE